MRNRQEGEIVKTVAQKVFHELKKVYLGVSNCFVSVDNQVDAIMEMIGAQTNETRIIGIHGMGGIGKTTIAKIIYNQASHNFEDRCFLRDIRETSKVDGIQCLQNQLISDISKTKCMDIKDINEGIQTIKDRLSNKRVLLLLDDVEEVNHINALVGKRDWLGGGSKIIITTRNENILYVPEVDCRYEVNLMDPDQSLKLFCRHAFRRDSPLDKYVNQSERATKIAGGLPLALEVIGSLLSCTKKEMWDSTLEKLETVPGDQVQSKLKISYKALDNRQKPIFLDIACLFIGYDKDIVIHFWDESKFFSEEAMETLQNKSLIKITEDNKVWMHDQFRDLGRDMVRQKSKMKIEKQSRVWDPKEGLDLLMRHKGNKEVEALRLQFDHQHRFTDKDFKGLPNLTFLKVNRISHVEKRLHWHTFLPTNVFQKNLNLLPQLRWLSWHDIPPSFEITNFSMENVVILDLSWSDITHNWKGWRHMKVMKNLKVLDMSNCHHLNRTPNFSAQEKLERLILCHCSELVEIDRSICYLKSLVSLDVSGCWKLRRLPDELGGDLASLKYLSLGNCALERLPNTIGKLKSLIELDISWTRIKELPNSIGELKNLKVVKMNPVRLSKTPDAFWMIETLEEIDASTVLPNKNFLVKIDDRIYGNKFLRILRLWGVGIYAVPRLPECLVKLELKVLYMDTFPDLSNLTNLKELVLEFYKPRDYDVKSDGLVEVPISRWIGNLSKLESLTLKSLHVTTLTEYLSLPPQLKSLTLWFCNLRNLPRLPSSLSSLCLFHCKSLCSMEDLSNLKKLSSLDISDIAIAEIQGLGCLENLQDLRLSCLGQVKIIPDLSNLNKLWRFSVELCEELIEIQGELPKSLEELQIYHCGSLEKLPDLSSLNRLRAVTTEFCGKLNVEAFLGFAGRSGFHFHCDSEIWSD